ncbi:hypothetical protein DYB30_000338 [Aphanomyces astaci]|uniref:EamA domain-containing protein n=1 Tax=Aphanomyces astaci TaxID=112090 RepID=A0A397DLE1_APHAT|nr:hypothetical protein DYB30_000338 [Aphanomyces astaci]
MGGTPTSVSDVYAVRLDELSSIVGVTESDLVAALQQEEVAVDVAYTDRPSVSPLGGGAGSFKGFAVGVDQLVAVQPPLSPPTIEAPTTEASSWLLLQAPPRHNYGTAKSRLKTVVRTIGRFQFLGKQRLARQRNTCLDGVHRLEVTLHTPRVRDPSTPLPWPVTPRSPIDLCHLAYMIPMVPSSSSPRQQFFHKPKHPHQYILAVQASPDEPDCASHIQGGGTLLRQLSNLATLPPSHVTNVTLETIHDNNAATVGVHVTVTKRVPVAGYVLLIAALVTISSLGAALDLQQQVDPFVKLFWRTTASIIGFLPFAAYGLYERGWPKWTLRLVGWFAASSVAYALFLMTFLWALNHTTIGHAYIFNNCHSLLIVMGKLVLGHPVVLFEIVGSGLGLVGGVVTTLDHASTSRPDNIASLVVQASWQGDVVALIGAVGGVFYLLTAKKLRQEMDVFVFMTLLFAATALLHIPVFYAMDIDVRWTTDHHVGWFGWVQPDMLGVELYLVFVCTIIGTVGYISVMKYFDPIVVSVVMLLEPVLATAMGVFVGVDAVPGFLTWIGGALVILGTGLVVLASANKIESHDVSDAIHKTPSTATVYSCKLKA